MRNTKSSVLTAFAGLGLLLLTTVSGASQESAAEFPIIYQLDIETTITDVDWNSDSTLLAFADGNDNVSVINVESSEIDLRLEREEAGIYVISSIGWSSTRNQLLIVSNRTRIWDYAANAWLDEFAFPSGLEFREYAQGIVDWHPYENRFAIILGGCEDSTPYRPGARVEIWNVEDTTFSQIPGCVGTVWPTWNPQGTQIGVSRFVFDNEGFVTFSEIQLWDVDAQEATLTITELDSPIGFDWSPAGDRIVFSTITAIWRFIEVRDAASGDIIWRTGTNLGVYGPVDWHPTEYLIATGEQDGSIGIWNAFIGVEVIELPIHEDAVNDVSWSPDGTMLASAGRDGRLFIWDVSSLLEASE